jgi:hypothetical protein
VKDPLEVESLFWNKRSPAVSIVICHVPKLRIAQLVVSVTALAITNVHAVVEASWYVI